MKIVSIIGARPQFVKAAVISRVLKRDDGCQEIIVHTGQHYDDNMSGVFFRELDIPSPDYNLGIGSGPHGEQTGKMLAAIERVLQDEKPDGVLVYGDTNSTIAGALAAVKMHIPLAHVEAGLRSFNRRMPEEINRIATDGISDMLFAPTETAVRHLRAEGHPESRIVFSGDVMYDASLYYARKALPDTAESRLSEVLNSSFILATIHRAENTDDPGRLKNILTALVETAGQVPVVWPVHPRTRNALDREGLLGLAESRLHLIDPVGYLEMIRLEKSARLIITDSGGVQKEAFFFGTPCVTLRLETEWVELVNAGWNRLITSFDTAALLDTIQKSLDDGLPHPAPGLYGDGAAGELIVSRFFEFLTSDRNG